MPEDLVQQIHSIEQEADAVIRAAQDEAAKMDRDAGPRIKKLQDELERKFQDETVKIASRVDAERQAEQEKLKKTFHASIENVRSTKPEAAKALVAMIAERISGS